MWGELEGRAWKAMFASSSLSPQIWHICFAVIFISCLPPSPDGIAAITGCS